MESLTRYFGGSQQEIPALRISRPEGVPDANWAAIESQINRLNTSISSGDIPLVIGSAKELAESVGKVVCDVRGKSLGNRADFPEVINAAHTELDRQPGQGLATERAVRDVAQAAKKIVCTLPEVRNLYGTGHGKAIDPVVVDEVALISVDAAMIWARWALRRLRFAIIGRPEVLIHQLDNETFRSGLLAEQLKLANLTHLPKADQRLIGLHVAWRALRDTFLVKEEGVEACTRSSDLDTWPKGYREGLLNGLLITESGTIYTNVWAIRQVAELLRATGDALLFDLTVLSHALDKATYSPGITEWASIPAACHENRGRIPQRLRGKWDKIAQRLAVPF